MKFIDADLNYTFIIKFQPAVLIHLTEDHSVVLVFSAQLCPSVEVSTGILLTISSSASS